MTEEYVPKAFDTENYRNRRFLVMHYLNAADFKTVFDVPNLMLRDALRYYGGGVGTLEDLMKYPEFLQLAQKPDPVNLSAGEYDRRMKFYSSCMADPYGQKMLEEGMIVRERDAFIKSYLKGQKLELISEIPEDKIRKAFQDYQKGLMTKKQVIDIVFPKTEFGETLTPIDIPKGVKWTIMTNQKILAPDIRIHHEDFKDSPEHILRNTISLFAELVNITKEEDWNKVMHIMEDFHAGVIRDTHMLTALYKLRPPKQLTIPTVDIPRKIQEEVNLRDALVEAGQYAERLKKMTLTDIQTVEEEPSPNYGELYSQFTTKSGITVTNYDEVQMDYKPPLYTFKSEGRTPIVLDKRYLEKDQDKIGTLCALLAKVQDFNEPNTWERAQVVLQRFYNGGLDAAELIAMLQDTVLPGKGDEINHPSHYTQYKGVEVIDVTQNLSFNRGNAVKYICRAGFKGEDTEIRDLKKALWYIDRAVRNVNNETEWLNPPNINTVQTLVGQMNYNRGTAVWCISLAGELHKQSGGDEWLNNMREAEYSIKEEIKRLEEL